MWYIYIQRFITIISHEILSAITKNEIMPHAATWMHLEIVILGEVSQEEKDKYILPLICVILKKWYK